MEANARESLKRPLIGAVFLFLSLCAWSFSGPLTSGYDTTYHLGNIWCARGERPGICEIRENASGVNVAFIPAELASNPNNESFVQADISSANRKSPFYSVMNTFVTKNATQSVLFLRIFNSIITGFVFFALMYLSSGKNRIAILSSWTFTIVPVLISTLWQPNPRSWAYLSVMSSWAFLHLALERASFSSARDRATWLLFVFSLILAFTSRMDATLFTIFSCSVVSIVYVVKNKLAKPKSLFVISLGSVLLFLIVRSLSSSLQWYTQFSFNSILSSGNSLFVLVHLPENIADGLGLGLRYLELGPNSIGIIGVSLFSISISSWLTDKNYSQHFGFLAMLLFMFLAMFQIARVWPEANEPSGAYVTALLTALLGITALLSKSDTYFPRAVSTKVLAVVLVSICHALTLYSKFEWSIRKDARNDTYTNLSLRGGWWWDSPVSPNLVFILGAISFPVWLAVSWNLVSRSEDAISS